MSLEGLKQGVPALIFIVLIIATLSLALSSFQSNILKDTAATRVSNESVTWINGTFVQFATPNNLGATCFNVTQSGGGAVLGNTQFFEIMPGNYTCNERGINVSPSVLGFNYTSTILVTYNVKTPNAQFNVTKEGLTGTLNASSFFGVIGTLLGVAALIAIVITAFYVGQR